MPSNNKTILSADRTLIIFDIIFGVTVKLQDKNLISIEGHVRYINLSKRQRFYMKHSHGRRFTEVYETVLFQTVCLAVADLI